MTGPERELIERFIAAYNRFDVDGMIAQLAPEIRFENYSGETLTVATDGINEFRALAERSKAMFSEREQRILSITPGDEHSAMVDIAYRGTLAMDVPDGPSAGTVIEISGRSEYSFLDGRITKIVDRSS
jgi:hypothetical protein